MTKQYTVVDEFVMKDAKVIVLDKERTLSGNDNHEFSIGDKKYPYSITHNEKWIVVKSDEQFTGKTITLM